MVGDETSKPPRAHAPTRDARERAAREQRRQEEVKRLGARLGVPANVEFANEDDWDDEVTIQDFDASALDELTAEPPTDTQRTPESQRSPDTIPAPPLLPGTELDEDDEPTLRHQSGNGRQSNGDR